MTRIRNRGSFEELKAEKIHHVVCLIDNPNKYSTVKIVAMNFLSINLSMNQQSVSTL